MIEFIPKKYDNDTTFAEIYNNSLSLDFLLNEIDIDFANKITGELGNETTNQFLKAISYRMESILFHYTLLYNINPKEHKSSFLEQEISIRQNCLFDSIIFHTASLFDYFSCLVWYMIAEDKKEKQLWRSLSKSARNNEQIKNSKICRLIDFYDREWITRLFDYRAQLIHYKDDWANETYSIKNKKQVVLSPEKVLKFFKIHKKIDIKNNLITIDQVSLWIIETSINICNELALALKLFINDNKKQESDIILFQTNSSPEKVKEIIRKIQKKL